MNIYIELEIGDNHPTSGKFDQAYVSVGKARATNARQFVIVERNL